MKSCEYFDFATDRWEYGPGLPFPNLAYAASVFLPSAGAVVLCGGVSEWGDVMDVCRFIRGLRRVEDFSAGGLDWETMAAR